MIRGGGVGGKEFQVFLLLSYKTQAVCIVACKRIETAHRVGRPSAPRARVRVRPRRAAHANLVTYRLAHEIKIAGLPQV